MAREDRDGPRFDEVVTDEVREVVATTRSGRVPEYLTPRQHLESQVNAVAYGLRTGYIREKEASHDG